MSAPQSHGAASVAASHTGSVATLNDARRARKQAELDVKALANRILLLQKTKKRAEDIIDLREENQRRKAALLEAHASVNVGIDPEVVQRRYVQKELAKASRKKQQGDLERHKRAEAKKFRAEKKTHENEMRRQREATQRKARERMAAVRKAREDAQIRLHKQREIQRVANRHAYDKRVVDERKEARKHERKVRSLEKKEMRVELIQRLQNTQALQRDAYLQLESALSNNMLPGANGPQGS